MHLESQNWAEVEMLELRQIALKMSDISTYCIVEFYHSEGKSTVQAHKEKLLFMVEIRYRKERPEGGPVVFILKI